jgi:outer membrane receptor for ferrienterochelin and colicin
MDFNRIEWGNTLFSVNWNRTLSDRLFSNTAIGLTSFSYSSRGSYDINYMDMDSTLNNSFDIFSTSRLKDFSITQSFDYYTNSTGIFKLGLSFIRHQNAPSIKESETFLDSSIQSFIALDSTYLSHEIFAFVENRINIKDRWSIHSGVRLNYFGGLDKRYFYLQPRININYSFGNNLLGLSYARMSQFIHLLVNPGPGLPSDLWVPSTAKVAPELSDVISLRYRYSTKNLMFSFSPFYNKYYNVIDYSNVSDILYSLIIDNQLFNVSVDNRNWEDRISAGEGLSYGIESHLAFRKNKWMIDVSYTLSKSTRQFAALNRGESFPYKYDRRHNISSRLVFNFSKEKSLQLGWVYGTGNAFTLATEEIKGPDCQPRLVPISRNNGRVPDYHHLDINYAIKKQLSNGAHIQYNFGIYNVYNRLNPFYVYLFQNPETRDFEGFRKISIYPIIPQINIKYSW